MDLDWQDATLPPQPTRAERSKQRLDDAYQRQLIKQQAKRDVAAEAEPPPALTRLAEALEQARDLIIQPDRQQDRAARAHLAAMQYESFQKVQTDLTGAMLRGQLDPAAHREACNSIEQVTRRLFLMAERLDRQSWAERPKDQTDDGSGIVAALEAASSRFRKITLEFHGPAVVPESAGVIEGESVRVPAISQGKP